MEIEYRVNAPITAAQFTELLRASGLGARRPVDDAQCMAGMVCNSNLLVTAWNRDRLVGIARSMTDFHYACYLSDLAVHKDYQRRGIGLQLQVLTQRELGPYCKLILIAAPDADAYYGHIGYTHNLRCWILPRGRSLATSGEQ